MSYCLSWSRHFESLMLNSYEIYLSQMTWISSVCRSHISSCFPLLWLVTGFASWLARWMPPVEQELPTSETLEFISALSELSCCLICLFICHRVLCLVLWFRLALQFPHKAMFGFSFYSHLFWRWLFMIFLIIHVYWCSIRFPYKKTLVSFNSNTHVTSEAGTLPFVPVVWWGSCWSVFILLFFCVVFVDYCLFFLSFFFWSLHCLSFGLWLLITLWYLQSFLTKPTNWLKHPARR